MHTLSAKQLAARSERDNQSVAALAASGLESKLTAGECLHWQMPFLAKRVAAQMKRRSFLLERRVFNF